MTIDHDQIFKQLIEAFFREFLELFCPDEARLIDFSNVEFLREEHFTDLWRGRRRLLDLVAKVQLKSGGEEFVLVHAEFEASRKKRNFPRRMFQYFCQLYLRHNTPVVPIALFTDEARWRKPVPDCFELSLPSQTFVRFKYYLIKLKNLDYHGFLNSENPLAFGLMAKMGYNRAERVRLKADFLGLILGAAVDPARKSLLVEFVETYLPLAGHERREFQQIVGSDQKYAKVEQMITTYEKEGTEKGKREVLILQLEKKFGRLDDAVKRRILQIDTPEKLDSLLLAVLDADSLEDLPW